MNMSIFYDNSSFILFAVLLIYVAFTVPKPMIKGLLLTLGVLLMAVTLYVTYDGDEEISPKQYQLVLNDPHSGWNARDLIRTEGKINKRQYGELLEVANAKETAERKIRTYTALQNDTNASVKAANLSIMGGKKNLRLTLDAVGCIAKTPEGIKPFNLNNGKHGETVLIPKGATFTSECFEGI